MNLLIQAIPISALLWSLLYDRIFLLIILILISIYYVLVYIILKDNQTTLRQKIRIASYNEAGDPTAFAKIEIDLFEADKFLEEYNQKNPEQKLSYAIIGLKAMGVGLKEIGCGKLSFSNFIPVDSEDSALIVNIKNRNIMNLTVRNCYQNSLHEIKQQIKGKIGNIKKERDPAIKRQTKVADLLPVFIFQILTYFIVFISYTIGIDFRPLKLKKNNFGFGIVTDVNGFDVSDAIPSHVNLLQNVLVQIITNAVYKVKFIDGKFVNRKCSKINLSFDPRFGQGDSFLRAIQKVKQVWENPKNYL